MKRVFWVMGLIIAAGLMVAGLALAQGSRAPAKTSPAPAAAPAPAPAPADSLERYWKMNLERMQVRKQNLQDQIAAYEKKEAASKAGKSVKEARATLQSDLKDAKAKFDAAGKDVEKKYDDVMAEEKKQIGDKQKALKAKRNDWLKQHPEVDNQVKALNKDIADSKHKLASYKPKPKPKAAAPTPPKTSP
jgi:hypothetical protein